MEARRSTLRRYAEESPRATESDAETPAARKASETVRVVQGSGPRAAQLKLPGTTWVSTVRQTTNATPSPGGTMGSGLGTRISNAREDVGLSLRKLAELVGKSPAFISVLENSDPAPKVSEETLVDLAKVLSLDVDELLGLAGRMPGDAFPESRLDVALYRRVHSLSDSRKEKLLRDLDSDT